MEFRDGMLGVVIIAIALTVALFGSYLAGVTPEEKDVTKYNYLADISGEFDYDKSPQYIEFDPSTNYTGYYSNNSYSDVGKKYYFAEDEVDYTPNQTDPPESKPIVNNYKIPLEPIVNSEQTTELVDVPSTSGSESFTLYYTNTTEGTDSLRVWKHENAPTTLSTLINWMQDQPDYAIIPEGTTNLRIVLGEGINWEGTRGEYGGLLPKQKLTLDTIFIVPDSWFYESPRDGRAVWLVNPELDIQSVVVPNNYRTDALIMNYPYLSFEIDLQSGFVSAYTDTDFSKNVKTFSWDHLWVCYGESTDDGNRLDLATSFINQPYTERRSYLNPNDGVWLKDTEEA